MTRRRGGRSQSASTMVAAVDSDHDSSTSVDDVEAPLKTFSFYLDQLEQKKASFRENALSCIIRILNDRNHYDNLQENFATTLYQILDSIKKGSAKEKQLASHVLGLMAMTISDSANAQEIYRESVPVLTKELTAKLVDPGTVVTLLDSLAMVTFFCANNALEREAAMQIIWAFIIPESKFDVSANKQVPAIISAAISAWSFLITTVDGWELNHKHWQGTISHFLNILESEDDSVCVAAAEALAVIFDYESLEKFSSEAENPTKSSAKRTKSPLKYSKWKNLIKGNILKQLEKVSKARSGVSLKQTFSNASRADWDVLKYFKDGKFPLTSERINGHKLTISSWSPKIQLKFLKNFLGEEEFLKHMLENELFHHLFDFTPIYKNNNTSSLYKSTMEKIKPSVYVPEEQNSDLLTRKEKKQGWQRRQSIIDKAKTKVLNKSRIFAEERKGKIHQIESQL